MFDENGKIIPATLIEAGPCFVVQIKNKEKDNYEAVQIGFSEAKDKNVKGPQRGHFKKAGLKTSFRYLQEFKNGKDLKVGDKIDVSVFKEGDKIKVTSISKGKGFQGVVKRHGFKGGPASHGQKHSLRAPGSIGSAFPERVFKGKKMAGRMGNERVTVKGLKVIKIDLENNLLAIKGAIAGNNGVLVRVVSEREEKK